MVACAEQELFKLLLIPIGNPLPDRPAGQPHDGAAAVDERRRDRVENIGKERQIRFAARIPCNRVSHDRSQRSLERGDHPRPGRDYDHVLAPLAARQEAPDQLEPVGPLRLGLVPEDDGRLLAARH